MSLCPSSSLPFTINSLPPSLSIYSFLSNSLSNSLSISLSLSISISISLSLILTLSLSHSNSLTLYFYLSLYLSISLILTLSLTLSLSPSSSLYLYFLSPSKMQGLEGYDFGDAGRLIYEFLWDEYADWYIEMSKSRMRVSGLRNQVSVISIISPLPPIYHSSLSFFMLYNYLFPSL